MSPRHSGSAILDYRFNRYFDYHLDCYAQSKGERTAIDDRQAMAGYVIVNTTLNTMVNQDLTLQISIFNLADERYTYALRQIPLAAIILPQVAALSWVCSMICKMVVSNMRSLCPNECFLVFTLSVVL